MKTIKFFAIIAVVALTASSCVSSGKYKTLLSQRDSLQVQTDSLQGNYNETLGILNDVQAGFDSIRESENKVKVELPNMEGKNMTKRQMLMNELDQIKSTLKANKARIARLEHISYRQGKKNKVLEATIARMQDELGQKTALIDSLQTELAKKNIKITQLTASVDSLNQGLSQLSAKSSEQLSTINSLNEVWYCVATAQKLKDSKILTSHGLFRHKTILDQKSFDKSVFTQADARKDLDIATGSTNAKILSTHPAGSYTLVKDKDNKITIKITDPAKFWSVSKYLVVKI